MADTAVKIGVITYDAPHLKTEQLTSRFLVDKARSEERSVEIKLLALPFSPRQTRQVLFQHRPDQEKAVATRELARFYDIEFLSCSYDGIPDVADYYLVAGAGILSSSAIGRKKIVNAHPGIIPSARGLDAFKWSILDQIPLGVSLHLIDGQVDAGEIIAVVETPVFGDDDLPMLARRHYERELDILCSFLQFIKQKNPGDSRYPVNPPRRRMPIAQEREMVAKFPAYKAKFAVRMKSTVLLDEHE